LINSLNNNNANSIQIQNKLPSIATLSSSQTTAHPIVKSLSNTGSPIISITTTPINQNQSIQQAVPIIQASGNSNLSQVLRQIQFSSFNTNTQSGSPASVSSEPTNNVQMGNEQTTLAIQTNNGQSIQIIPIQATSIQTQPTNTATSNDSTNTSATNSKSDPS
jgi:hypothetical protein